MSLSQHNLPIAFNRDVTRFFNALWQAQDRQLSALGCLLYPAESRRYRSFYCCYLECVPAIENDWAIRIMLSGTVNQRCWQPFHVLGCVKLPTLSKLAPLGIKERSGCEHQIVAWQQHMKWLLKQNSLHALFCAPDDVGHVLSTEGIQVDLPPLIACAGSAHIQRILSPALITHTANSNKVTF